jgi:hypothetical protein
MAMRRIARGCEKEWTASLPLRLFVQGAGNLTNAPENGAE